jgi:hypothetical protein
LEYGVYWLLKGVNKMNTMILVALICTSYDTTSCQAYHLDSGLSPEDCHTYFTDSGTQQIDTLLAMYIPDYKSTDDLVLSCEEE